MKVIFLSDNGRHHQKYTVKLWSHIILPLSLLTLLVITALAAKNYYSKYSDENLQISHNEKRLLNKFDLLLKKASALEAEIDRLNTLGKTIATNNEIDIAAFHLDKTPARGGFIPNNNSLDLNSETLDESDLIKSIELIESRLKRQKVSFQKLNNVSSKSNNFSKASFSTAGFYSSPVKTGYISSAYGKRRDPINGHQRHHNGIDIAAKLGTEINTIGSGFVTFAGRKGGYGNVVEIHHSDALKSRYAHLRKILVKKGDVVHKGDKIATMGKTGRATGSHLHLEVWENDKPTNPEGFINIALKNLKK
ncbi:M23 family metallopeptidase [Cocleimonas sp. KMM 6892]|uniref:M23 family metallopeptidase n=1 Tax=unclassified Cocleimonas TaxID=2639732 RepID=UPI002DB96220|nr:MULTISPECIES: M23 family metallopeptidase [unclassified Cocleimonas]MEB8433697.1 M23 family metallopeptidase [Cocleimonas sp. KMM 6892]MEC4716508.1 M23 family metallopeptidase [Cocleimonas sp. KMM 6895]MEC4745599.1 M23 family metallopeptidase [Cocleimonas sp. KMM 6896]